MVINTHWRLRNRNSPVISDMDILSKGICSAEEITEPTPNNAPIIGYLQSLTINYIPFRVITNQTAFIEAKIRLKSELMSKKADKLRLTFK